VKDGKDAAGEEWKSGKVEDGKDAAGKNGKS
jgi:hypothetical protein